MMTDELKTMDGAIRAVTMKTGKYLTFNLGEEIYGIGILKVKEIIGMMPVASVPKTPEFVKGVINLRGKVIPVIDLRLKFSMPAAIYTERTCIVVVEVDSKDSTVLIGVIVDAVSEVLHIRPDEIENAPEFGKSLDTAFILGLAKSEKGVKILLDIDRVLNTGEIQLLNETA
jgi:purine-binding chemotaxis protein CheW